MSYLLTISYHNQQIAETTYRQLVKTMSQEPCQVLLLDNNCPLMSDKNYLPNLCKELGFIYHNAGKNLGLHDGYNYLISNLPEDADRYILFDGDSYPITENWHIPLLKLHDDSRIVWTSLYNKHSYKEMSERSFRSEVLFGYNCQIVLAPVINSISCFKKSWTDSVGGLTEPMRFYGGLEMSMWHKKSVDKLWVFLNDYKEESNPTPNDPIYTEYKVAHAVKGLDISLEEFIMKKKENEILSKIENLSGWCSLDKAIKLYNFIKENKIKSTLEIGVYGAKSLVPMAMAHQEFGGTLIGIDPYSQSESQQMMIDGNPFEFSADWEDIYSQAIVAISSFPGTSIIKKSLADYYDPSLKFDLIHLDGNHSRDNVLRDLTMIETMTHETTFIVIDDVNWDTVKAGINDYGKLELVSFYDTWAIYKIN